MLYNEAEFIQRLSGLISEKRFNHSIGVRDTAVEMATRFGEDVTKARIAGLLHDCAKELPLEKAIKKCHALGVEYDAIELENPALLHAPLGAALVSELFGVEDAEVKSAIRYHTVGHANMTRLEMIIYLADMIEPNRDYEGVEILRTLANQNLEECFLEALRQVIEFNAHKGRLIHLGSVEAYNDMKRKKEGGLV